MEQPHSSHPLIFRHKIDVLPTAIVLISSTLQYYLFFSKNIGTVPFIVLLLILWFLSTLSIPIAHNHYHHFIFTKKWMNRLFEYFLFYHVFLPSFGWQLNHNIGHHRNYHNQNIDDPDHDENCWMTKNGEIAKRWYYTLRTAALGYYYIFRNGKKHKKMFQKFKFVMLIHILCIAFFLYINPLYAFLIFLIPMVSNLLLNTNTSYRHHVGLTSTDVFSSSHTNLSTINNILTFNTGYHTAHHHQPWVHWSKLPQLHEKIKAHIPATCIQNNFFG